MRVRRSRRTSASPAPALTASYRDGRAVQPRGRSLRRAQSDRRPGRCGARHHHAGRTAGCSANSGTARSRPRLREPGHPNAERTYPRRKRRRALRPLLPGESGAKSGRAGRGRHGIVPQRRWPRPSHRGQRRLVRHRRSRAPGSPARRCSRRRRAPTITARSTRRWLARSVPHRASHRRCAQGSTVVNG